MADEGRQHNKHRGHKQLQPHNEDSEAEEEHALHDNIEQAGTDERLIVDVLRCGCLLDNGFGSLMALSLLRSCFL